MASLFERQRADVESRLDAIVRGGEPVTSRLLASLQGALGLDGLILDDEGVPRDAPGSDTRALVEHALCRLTQRGMQEETEGGGEVGPGSSARDDDDRNDASGESGSRLDRCLDLALALSETGVAEPGSVFVAAEQVFEASTVEACARVFSWVERARERLSDDALWKRGKLTMLRTCNDLARRLSKGKTSDVVLRGRVSLLLAALYPLSERSALNISGAYNDDENRAIGVETRLDAAAPRAASGGKATKTGNALADAVSDASVDEASSAVDAAFYRTFWNLQVFFRDPPSTLGAGPGGWSAFQRSLEAVLAAFETHQLDRSAAAEAEAATAAAAFATGGGDDFGLAERTAQRGNDSMDADDGLVDVVSTENKGKRRSAEEARLFKKASVDSESAGVTYLTAAPLLRLQLRDAAFRRHFLTQCAVFLNHRDDIAPTEGLRSSSGSSRSGKETASVEDPKTSLERADADAASERKTRAEAEQLRRRVFRQLAATPPAGAKFAEAVSLALRRERHWTRWKRENCRAFERAPEPGGLDGVPPPEPEPPLAPPAAAGGRARARRVPKRAKETEAGSDATRVRLGVPELDRLWNLPGGDAGDAGRGPGGAADTGAGEGKRKLEAFMRRVHEDADPEAEIEEPYKARHDAAFRWRLTRLLAAEDMGAFVKLASGEDLELVAAEALGLPPWPEKAKPGDQAGDGEKEEAAGPSKAADAEKRGGGAPDAADAPADAADGEDAAVAADGEVAAGEAAGEEKKKRASSVTTKTKTGGGEHTRFASTPATTDEFRGDSDMGSDSDGRDLVAEVG